MSSSMLSEEQIANSFHSYLKSSLTQAKVERLVDTDLLTSAEGDVMITGPALCLYFAALRCTTHPPSVPLPRHDKTGPDGQTGPPMELSFQNCPPAFTPFLTVWASNVPRIQALSPEHQHDLARVICGLDPISQPLNTSLNGIAAELRAIAIDISQRRTFQDRYASDLQAAIDAGESSGAQDGGSSGSGSRLKPTASFVPPPMYDPSPQSSPGHSPQPSPRQATHTLPPSSPTPGAGPSSVGASPRGGTAPLRPHPRTPTTPRSPVSPAPAPASPSLLPPDAPAIQLIRETLYAALGDVLSTTPSLLPLLVSDQPRAYFSAVALAILATALTAMTDSGGVIGVLGAELTLAQCPPELRPFMIELGRIRAGAKAMEEEDNADAMRRVQRGLEPEESRMERVRQILEQGIGYHSALRAREDGEGRRSLEGRAATFANGISALALGMTRLKAFRDRQGEVFKILAAVTGTDSR